MSPEPAHREVLIHDAERWFELVKTSTGLILSVLCGGIGVYEVAIRLTEEEATRFAEEGATFIQDLAYRVARNPDAFADREVREHRGGL